MKVIIKTCDMANAKIKLAIQNIEAKVKASMEREEFSKKTKKKRSVYFSKENSRNSTTWNTFKNLIPLSQTTKIKIPTGKPKMTNVKELMRNSTFLKSNERCLNIQPRPQTLKEQLNAQHPARQTFKKVNRHNANKTQYYHHKIYCKQTNRIVIKVYYFYRLKSKVQRVRTQIPKVKN